MCSPYLYDSDVDYEEAFEAEFAEVDPDEVDVDLDDEVDYD